MNIKNQQKNLSWKEKNYTEIYDRINSMVLVKGHGTDADNEFREALKKRLDEFPYPKYRAAMHLGISQGQLSGILTHTRSSSLGMMEKIAKSLGTSVADMLLEGKEILNQNNPQDTLFANSHKKTLEAFKECLLYGGEAAELLAQTAIALAKKKQAEAIFQNHA